VQHSNSGNTLKNLSEQYDSVSCNLIAVNENHIPNLFQLFSKPKNIRFTDNFVHKSLADSHDFYLKLKKLKSEGELTAYLIAHPNKEIFCGYVQFYHADNFHKFISFGIFVEQKWRKFGFANHALELLFTEIFRKTDFNRIEAQVYTANKASIRLLEKVGMKREGMLRQNFLIDGKFRDSFLYSVLRSEYIY